MNKKLIGKRYILIADAVILLGSLLTIFFLVGYAQPLVIAPLADSDSPLIFDFPSADYFVFDDNLQFDSPQTVFIDETLSLEPGRYYIKSVSGLYSEVRQINTEVDIFVEIRRLSDGSVGLFNIGDSDLQVETYKIGSLVNRSLVSAEENG